MNRQSSAAHKLIFQQIDEIVKNDTGHSLEWRHLHANSINDDTGILQLAADQHGGQAKGSSLFVTCYLFVTGFLLISFQLAGLGLYLEALAQRLPPKYDLHETGRLISSLDAYEHLRRIFRLCNVHVHRNIKKSTVSESVKNKMRGLICLQHPRWDETLREIELEGGKAGTGMQYIIFNSFRWSILIPIHQTGCRTKFGASSHFLEFAGRRATYLNESGKSATLIAT